MTYNKKRYGMSRRVMRRRARSPVEPGETSAWPADPESDGGLDALTRPLSSPLVVLTQPGLMLLTCASSSLNAFLQLLRTVAPVAVACSVPVGSDKFSAQESSSVR